MYVITNRRCDWKIKTTKKKPSAFPRQRAATKKVLRRDLVGRIPSRTTCHSPSTIKYNFRQVYADQRLSKCHYITCDDHSDHATFFSVYRYTFRLLYWPSFSHGVFHGVTWKPKKLYTPYYQVLFVQLRPRHNDLKPMRLWSWCTIDTLCLFIFFNVPIFPRENLKQVRCPKSYFITNEILLRFIFKRKAVRYQQEFFE